MLRQPTVDRQDFRLDLHDGIAQTQQPLIVLADRSRVVNSDAATVEYPGQSVAIVIMDLDRKG